VKDRYLETISETGKPNFKKASYDNPWLSLVQHDPGEMLRKPTDKIFSELGGAAALISPQTAFHSAVLLLAAFEGSERREDRR
jgi:hypothetical protein